VSDDARRILAEIEQVRAQLTELVGRAGLTDPEVQKLSRKMDILVAKYYRIRRNSGGEPAR
jgi:hypothetical protein